MKINWILEKRAVCMKMSHFIDCRSLMKHLEYYPDRRYPLEAAKKNRLMSAFLVELGG